MAHDIFISHSRRDKQIAKMVCDHLEQNGMRCWMAPRDIPEGKKWAEAIVNAILESNLVLLIFSSNSNDSDQITNEVNIAADDKVSILPFRIEDVKPAKELRYYLNSRQWFDAIPPPIENHLGRLTASVRLFLPDMPTPKPAPPRKPAPAPEPFRPAVSSPSIGSGRLSVTMAPPVTQGEIAEIPTYLAMSLFSLLFCWPAAVVSVILAVLTTQDKSSGNYEAALRRSGQTRTSVIISFVLGIVALFILILGQLISKAG
jgi:hypothetical protein